MPNRTCPIEDCEREAKAHGLCGMHNERRRRNGDPNNPGRYARNPLERLANYLVPGDPDQCWPWQGPVNRDGYGTMRVGTERFPAHRYVYEHLVGPIPDGLHIDHVRARGCTTRACVNPAHLEPVTQTVNTMRGDCPAALNARKTHCPEGHEYDKVSIDAQGRKSRRCTICQREWARRNPKRRRAAVA